VQDEQMPTTLDLAMVDLYTGQARFYKQGAVGTFIRRGHQVLQIDPGSLPMGVDCEAAPACARIQLEDGDMVVMVTDGVLDAIEGDDKEASFCEYLSSTTKNNARELAEDLLQMAKASQAGGTRDDMTVLTAGIWKK
ncbi:MAG: SpoIIE family protein phosphatase, partial [Lachnospiraceae bacterium]|nr:SpoIIE family protein phosphatase [Lachnospiraceae bacterium]